MFLPHQRPSPGPIAAEVHVGNSKSAYVSCDDCYGTEVEVYNMKQHTSRDTVSL